MKQTQLAELTLVHAGKRVRTLAGPIYDRARFEDRPRDLVLDADGNVWEAARQQEITSTKTVQVAACEWGCFAPRPGGEDPGVELGRNLWLLGAKQKFKGEVAIDFSAPYLAIKYTYIECAPAK